jgi:N,N'-diacetylchitobiose transport system permease protein
MSPQKSSRTVGGTVAAGAPARKKKFNPSPYFLILPAVVVLIFALGYPLIWQIVTSFQKYGRAQAIMDAPAPFVGLQNYEKIFTSSDVWKVVGYSIAFCLINAALTLVIGIALAQLMKAIGNAARLILQVCLLLAWAMPVVAAMTVWTWLFDFRRGVINWLLTRMGFDFTNFNWLGTNFGLWGVATVIVVWMSVPFVAFSVYSGLTQVSEEVLEASQLDGASNWQRFWNIIMPMVRPVLMIVGLLQIIWDLRVYAQITMLQTYQNPIGSDLLGTYIQKMGMSSGDFGMASALSIFVLVLTVVLSAPYVLKLMKED